MNKVLFITGSLPPINCGVGFYSKKLLSKLVDVAEVSLIRTSGTAPISGTTSDFTIPDWKIKRLNSIYRVTKKSGADVIHIQYPAVGYKHGIGINLLPFWLKLRGVKTPICVTLHEYYGSRLVGRLRNLLTIAVADSIIVSNAYDAAVLPRWAKKRVSIIPIGSNIEKAAPSPRTFEQIISRVGLKPSLPTIVFFGLMTASKNIEALLEAMKLMPHLQLLVLSRLDDSDEYIKRVKRLVIRYQKAGAHIGLAGYQDDAVVSEVLQECSIFVMPSSVPLSAKSGTTIAAVEHNLVIVAKAAANLSLNKPYDNTNSILIDNLTADTLAEEITELMANPPRLQKLRREALALEKYFSWPKIIDMHEKLYEGTKR